MRNKTPKAAYLLPNFFTAASIFSGVFSMVFSIEGDYVSAAWMIFLALVFDGLDGRVARLTHTTSQFGMEFDSLADIVAFGVAPSILMYNYLAHDFGRLGIIVCALFVMFGAIRLARFNVMNATTEPSVFIGVPIPTAAVFLAIMVLLFEKYALAGWVKIPALVMMMAVSLLMVSNVRYPSFKKIDHYSIHFMRTLVLFLLSASLVLLYPIEGLALLFCFYIFYGPIRAIYTIYTRYKLMR